MRHKGVDKEETRRKMIEAVGCGFRKQGYAGIGVDSLAKAAGVTSGAFYSHFGSKGAAFKQALVTGLDEVIEAIPAFQSEFGVDWVNEFSKYYLSKVHQKDLECGCAMATLTSEVIRFGDDIHDLYEERMTIIANLVALGLEGESEGACRARAWAMLSLLIGGISVTRAMNSTAASKEVAGAIKMAAILAAGQACVVEA